MAVMQPAATGTAAAREPVAHEIAIDCKVAKIFYGTFLAVRDSHVPIQKGKITGFIDHQVPPAIPLVGIIQESLFANDGGSAALATLDNEWRKVAARTIPLTED